MFDNLKKYKYFFREFCYFVPRAIYRLLRPLNDRNPEMVRRNYDLRYQTARQMFRRNKVELNDFLFNNGEANEWILIDNKTDLGRIGDIYKSFVPNLDKYLSEYLEVPGNTIVEFGCGNGRNLLYLKSRYPKINFIGLEISEEGVTLAREIAKAYSLDIEYRVGDLTKGKDLGLKADIAFTVHALEQMPRIFSQTVANMAKISGGKIILFEPVPDLYPWWSTRGLTARARAIVIDHVRNVLPTLKLSGFVIDEARRLGVGSPLTETCVVRARVVG